jgi:hypothetical protein
MAALWIMIIAIATYLVTISLVVIGQEVHPMVSVAIAIAVIYGAVKLFTSRVTRI